jgi:hypothetical protein
VVGLAGAVPVSGAATVVVGGWLAQLTGAIFMADFTVAITGAGNRGRAATLHPD